MFIAGDATKGDCSREKACEFFDELFYEKLQMPSSYEANEGYTREEAIDKEVLPPATDRQFRSFYDEQMAKIDAEQERQRRIDNLGFDPDDPDIIDVADNGAAINGQPANTSRAVGQAQTTAVGMPKKIFYAVDFHCPAGGMLGYGGGGRLDGRRRPGGYLREDKQENPTANIKRAYAWGKTKGLDAGLVAIAAAEATRNDVAGCLPYIFKYQDGTVKYVTEFVNNGEFDVEWEGPAGHFPYDGMYRMQEITVMTKAELDAAVLECDEESDSEKMMKEFVEKKENGEVEEDEYRRPKNQPHNLHRVDEDDDSIEEAELSQDDSDYIAALTGNTGDSSFPDKNNPVGSNGRQLRNILPPDEERTHYAGAADLEDESEDQFELNESMVRFCDRLIRG